LINNPRALVARDDKEITKHVRHPTYVVENEEEEAPAVVNCNRKIKAGEE